MRFEWDAAKAKSNVLKHGISFELASTVFQDPVQMSLLDPGPYDEERWVTIGLAADRRTLVVVHLYLNQAEEIIRIISARKATKREKKDHEEGI